MRRSWKQRLLACVVFFLGAGLFIGCGSGFVPNQTMEQFRWEIRAEENLSEWVSATGEPIRRERTLELRIEEESLKKHSYGFIPVVPLPDIKVFVDDQEITPETQHTTGRRSTTYIAKIKPKLGSGHTYLIRIESGGKTMKLQYTTLFFGVTSPDRIDPSSKDKIEVQLGKHVSDYTNIRYSLQNAYSKEMADFVSHMKPLDLCAHGFKRDPNEPADNPLHAAFFFGQQERYNDISGKPCYYALQVNAKHVGELQTEYNPVTFQNTYSYSKTVLIK